MQATCAAPPTRSAQTTSRCDLRKFVTRCSSIGYLEDWVKRGEDGDLARELIAFYASLRRNLIEAAARMSAEIFERQMADVLEMRKYWQQIESRMESSGPEILLPELRIPAGYPVPQIECRQSSWSA